MADQEHVDDERAIIDFQIDAEPYPRAALSVLPTGETRMSVSNGSYPKTEAMRFNTSGNPELGPDRVLTMASSRKNLTEPPPGGLENVKTILLQPSQIRTMTW